MLIIIAESSRKRPKLSRHPANAGLNLLRGRPAYRRRVRHRGRPGLGQARRAKSGLHGKGREAVAENGDKAPLDFTGKGDGEPFEGNSGENVDVVLGSGSFLPGLRNNPGVFARLYASHGADADRFQRRVIQFASIIFSHAGRESLQTLHVKKKVHMLIT